MKYFDGTKFQCNTCMKRRSVRNVRTVALTDHYTRRRGFSASGKLLVDFDVFLYGVI